jgi:hypothetical protein
MKKTVIDKLIDEINKANKDCAYPQIGHMRYANITGDGRNYRTVYVITNEQGGVTACHNGRTDRETAANLRSILAALKEMK